MKISSATKPVSCKRLSELLVEIGYLPEGTKLDTRKSHSWPKGIHAEAFERDVFVFIPTPSLADRLKLQFDLVKKGVKVHSSYNPGGVTACVYVTYFKAWHWDE